MDAASQTGKDDVLELLEGVGFVPDLVALQGLHPGRGPHALAARPGTRLLKTVEEPPPHAKFVFATTELAQGAGDGAVALPAVRAAPGRAGDAGRSICAGICAQRGRRRRAPTALALIARAAEGSVRDALSLLDQAIATSDGPVEAELVQAMLGLGDRLLLLELLAAVLRGDARRGARPVRGALRAGGRPAAVVQDLLELAHRLSRAQGQARRPT